MKKTKFIIPSVIIALIGSAAAALTINASNNKKEMNAAITEGMSILNEYYTITPYDTNEYTDITMRGIMKFHTNQYKIEDLGNLSVMTTDMGFMQMASFVITPFEKKMPLCSLDFMYITKNRKSYVEFYDIVEDPSASEYIAVLDAMRELSSYYVTVDDIPDKENWYDNILSVKMHKSFNHSNADLNHQLFCDSIRQYAKTSKNLPVLSEKEAAAQLKIIENYSNGLIEKGGISTDFFKKSLGEDTTRDFFNKVFFGTDNYRIETDTE